MRGTKSTEGMIPTKILLFIGFDNSMFVSEYIVSQLVKKQVMLYGLHLKQKFQNSFLEQTYPPEFSIFDNCVGVLRFFGQIIKNIKFTKQNCDIVVFNKPKNYSNKF
eukprot:TRINITY_DN23842_c1_g1_i1.p3 TRINITY_DN23842_c1_g1~~TRINITY_DN23842_c1_g1_i1.p3  ORF type:complete len:107 (-),score=6.12 TRINITY_DN23842_c1_g1_i1:213-533(-)